MGGMSITADHGAELNDTSPKGLEDRMVATLGEGDEGEEDIRGKSTEETYAEMVSRDAAAFRRCYESGRKEIRGGRANA